jgi:hypothetical protein
MGKVEFDDPADKDKGENEVKYRRLKITFNLYFDAATAKRLGTDFYSALYEDDGATLRKNLHNIKSKTQLFQVNQVTLTDPEGLVLPLTTECWVNASVKVDVVAVDHDPLMKLQLQIPRDHEILCRIDDLKKRPEISIEMVRSEGIEEDRNAKKSVEDKLIDAAVADPHAGRPESPTGSAILPDPSVTLESLIGAAAKD